MATALVPLATITLGATQATVTFSSIPTTYRDLRLVMTPVSSGGYGNMNQVYFNGSSAANYNIVSGWGTGSAVSFSTAVNSAGVDWGLYDAGNMNVFTVDIMDYSITDKHTTFIVRGHSATQRASWSVGRWASTAAISSIAVKGNTTFAAGTTMSLWGVLA